MRDSGAAALLGRSRPVDIDPQQTLLADLPFDVNDFDTNRARHALRCPANLFEVHRHHNLAAGEHLRLGQRSPGGQFAANKKVGSRPLELSSRFEPIQYSRRDRETQAARSVAGNSTALASHPIDFSYAGKTRAAEAI